MLGMLSWGGYCLNIVEVGVEVEVGVGRIVNYALNEPLRIQIAYELKWKSSSL